MDDAGRWHDWSDASRFRRLRERLDRLVIERTALKRKLAAQRTMTSILETNFQEKLERDEMWDERSLERGSDARVGPRRSRHAHLRQNERKETLLRRAEIAAQTKELEARDAAFKGWVTKAARQ